MHLVVIGNGIAGVTCARHVRKLDPAARITLVSDETDHPYSRTALMYVYMGHLTAGHTKLYEDGFWPANRIDLVRGYVERVEPERRRLHLRSGEALSYDRLLIACGSRPRFAGWPGQDLDGVQGLYGFPDLERMEAATRGIDRAAVVGGGLIGVELAEMLVTRGVGVTFLVREGAYFGNVLPAEEAALVGRELRRHGVDLRLGTELAEVLPDAAGRARAVVTTAGEEIPAAFVGVAIGVEPNVDFLRGSGIEVGRGVLVNRCFETSVEAVYAAGDCAEFREPLPERKAVEQLWYTGRLHGATVAHTLCGRRRPYDPGVFFNSAKFFDVEYQTYGRVEPALREGEETLYWEHPDGRRSIRITYTTADPRGDGASAGGRVVGFNLLGVRYRQDACARWIAEEARIEEVLEHLGAANFDPEFFPQFEGAVVATYNRRHPERPVRLKVRRGWRRWMAKNTLTGFDIPPGQPLP